MPRTRRKSVHTDNPTLYRRSTTNRPLKQTARTVSACIRYWPSDGDAGVVFGEFVRHDGRGSQLEGCFKFVRADDAFLLRLSGAADGRWTWLSKGALDRGFVMSRDDIAQTQGDVPTIMDPTDAEMAQCRMQHRARAIGASFGEFASDANFCPFAPESLACMTRRNGAWVRWEGLKDQKLLAQIERHLATSSRTRTSPAPRARIAGNRLEIELDHDIDVGPFEQTDPVSPKLSKAAAATEIQRGAHQGLRLVMFPVTARNTQIPMQFSIGGADGETGAGFEVTVDPKRSMAHIVARGRFSVPVKDFAIAELRPIARTGRLRILRVEYFRFDEQLDRRYGFTAPITGQRDDRPKNWLTAIRWALRR